MNINSVKGTMFRMNSLMRRMGLCKVKELTLHLVRSEPPPAPVPLVVGPP